MIIFENMIIYHPEFVLISPICHPEFISGSLLMFQRDAETSSA